MEMRRHYLIPLIIFSVVVLIGGYFFPVFAQEHLVEEQLRKIVQGKVDEVKKLLPDLLLQYPNDPGVIFLHAAVAQDAMMALPLYQKIVEDYPQSVWADDALWRIVQIYALAGDTLKARYWLSEFQHLYPDSELLVYAYLLVKETVGVEMEEKGQGKKTSPVTQSPQQTSEQTKKSDTPEVIIRGPRYNNQPPAEVPDTAFGKLGGTEQTSKSQETENGGAVRYGLQVGLYASREKATQEKLKYERLNLNVAIIEKLVGGEPHYAVVIGEYTSIEEANRAKPVVSRFCQCTPFVIVK